ncbi:rhodanese-like domain-containing protein [Methylococcus mesophilus]|uniref:rhodanese-like domain-containing protein n=1 Tax=Methylococcus mesophilus TaxID=2993564 RepID=UPI00224B9E82|nr:rhodanese-like domain-containing protein [Methylococcus mesophilus]UZR29859.1 rhodanese-like domain-containing protein [Methylococcus mesophilus]
MRQLDPTQVKDLLDQLETRPLLLDVRESNEFAYCRIEGSLHVPMGEIVSRLNELDPDRQTVVICHHGMRSFQVAQFLESQGFSHVINLAGGIDAWAREVDHTVPRY